MNRWASVKLGDVASKIGSGATPRGGSDSYQQTGVPLIRSMNVRFEGFDEQGLAFLSETQARALDGVVVEANDVLLNITGASIGRVTLAPSTMRGARVNQHVCIIRPRESLDPRFVGYFLRTPAMQRMIMAEQYGATRQALTKSMILDFDVPLPPLNEQRRIVAKLEDLLARSRRAKAALDAVPALLERFRQSVLAAAFRGDLTRDWREKNPNVEPASKLLERIRVERRRRWEEAELEKMKAKGKAPKDDSWKSKYEEPVTGDQVTLPDLPDTWACATVESFGRVQLGRQRSPENHNGPHMRPYLRAANVTWDGLALTDVNEMNFDPALSENYRLGVGDILLAEASGSAGEVGKPALWNSELAECYFQNTLIRVRSDGPEPEFLYFHFLLNALSGSFAGSSRGIGIHHLGAQALSQWPVAIPPLSEQRVIVIRVREQLERLSKIESATIAAQSEVSRLDAAVLARAFRGELVSQDPSDEPASTLLERIRAEREASDAVSVPSATKRPRKSKVA